MKKVACIGSRETPDNTLVLMEKIGAYLAQNNYIISTGNALGADQAFARGGNSVDPRKVRLYLPWPAYEADKIVKGNDVITYQEEDWFTESAKYHPAWKTLKDSVKKLHSRNIGIVKGSCLVICYLNHRKPGGGGTGQGVRYAQALGIPVIDLATREGVNRIERKLL